MYGLLGENGAGKTTLMNIVYGLIQPDSGYIEFEGKAVTIKNPKNALAQGIGMVHQHFMLVPDMTIAENVALGLGRRWLRRSLIAEVAAGIRTLSKEYGLELDPDDVIEETAVGVRQRVEIVKLLYRGAELLIMDEPTAALTPPEWRRLAVVLRSLVAAGRAVIFITHKLEELFDIANRCTVLRDGCVVGETEMGGTTKAELAHLMVGRPVSGRVERTRRIVGAPVLRARGLRLVEPSGRVRVSGIDLVVREHEIFGIAGVDGNGQRELVELLIGVREATEGEISIDGVSFAKLTPTRFKAASGAVIPEDRQHAGSVLSMSVAENLILKDFRDVPFSRRGVLNSRAVAKRAERAVSDYGIRCASVQSPLAALSGGNQQKVVLARELFHQPRVLIAAQPTRGLDVGAVETVYRRLLDYRDAGGAVLLISIELDEILSLADRIAVMVRGEFVRTIDVDDANPELLGLLMAGEGVPERARA